MGRRGGDLGDAAGDPQHVFRALLVDELLDLVAGALQDVGQDLEGRGNAAGVGDRSGSGAPQLQKKGWATPGMCIPS